jgi:flagellar biosynthetic protein FliR
MEPIYNLLISNFKLFVAIACRIGGLFFVAPFFGHRNIPLFVRAGLVFFVSLILLPLGIPKEFILPDQFVSYLILLAQEALMGGSLLGLQLNLGQGGSEEGESEDASPVTRLQVFLGLLIFLALNGHQLIISAIFQSFELVPVGKLSLTPVALNGIAGLSGSVFLIALKISAPVIITLFIVDILTGVLGRTIPQSNLYQSFMTLRLGAGLLILALSFPVFGTIMDKLLLETDSKLIEVLKNLK